ncbi:hypothetical protein DVH05_007681 [Phytophthora capsici]|nr:hypothetical protein DVH05_007681 [Phytophthora capsici]
MSKSFYEQLVHQTVHGVLFREDTQDKDVNHQAFDTVNPTETIPKDSLLHFLINSGNEEPALDENNNYDDVADYSRVMNCASWSVEQLRREKRTIKHYLNSQHLKLCHSHGETLGSNLPVFEAYALIKLFLLERDLDYRQCLQQSIGCENTFVTLIQVLLTLYARYFERVHGRQISDKTDIKPIETLYDFFLAHYD